MSGIFKAYVVGVAVTIGALVVGWAAFQTWLLLPPFVQDALLWLALDVWQALKLAAFFVIVGYAVLIVYREVTQ